MSSVAKRRFIDIPAGFFWLCHPGPVCLHIIAVSLFALLAGWPHIIWSTFGLVVGAHLAMQLSIAVFNDYCDRQSDALSKKNKPIVRGFIQPREAFILTFIFTAIMVALLLPLPPLALVVSLFYLACGQSYNLGLKATPWSGIIFAIMMPLIPVYAFAGMGHIMPFVFWQIPVAALLGVVINLANSLPDIEQDEANQQRTLAVVLGVQDSFLLCLVLIMFSILLITFFTLLGQVAANLWILLPVLTLATLAVMIMFFALRARPMWQINKVYFYSTVSLCLLLAVGWLVSVVVP